MKKKLLHNSLLGTYSLMAGYILASHDTNAQIIYTDIDPDQFKDNNNSGMELSVPVDLNNDGTVDIIIKNNYCTWCNYYVMKAQVDSNQVAIYNTFYLPAKQLEYGDTISSGLEKWQQNVVYLIFGNKGVWGGSGYLPIRLKKDQDYLYGWIRLEVSGDDKFYVKDYAYNSVLNQPITAGQTTPCADGFENNNSFAKAKRIKSGLAYHSLIDISGDGDFFKLSLEEPNMRITLSGLPQNYNIQLFTADKQLIGSSLNTGLKNDTIVYNNAPAGKYFIRVFAKSDQFDPINCYTLKVEIGESPYRLNTEEEPMLFGKQVFVYPNPASKSITIANVTGIIHSVKMLDMAGKTLKEWNPKTEHEELILNINDIKGGYYLLHIAADEEVIIQKVIVTHVHEAE